MSARAEAFVSFAGGAPDRARLAALAGKSGAAFEIRPGRIHIEVGGGSGAEALAAAAHAALALIEILKDESAAIENLKLVLDRAPARVIVSRGSLSKEKPVVKPQTLMGEVTAPRPAPDNAREAFRHFMTSHRLRPTTWAKDAGVSNGEILGFLTGRSRGLSGGVAEKLARAAKVSVEDMFR